MNKKVIKVLWNCSDNINTIINSLRCEIYLLDHTVSFVSNGHWPQASNQSFCSASWLHDNKHWARCKTMLSVEFDAWWCHAVPAATSKSKVIKEAVGGIGILTSRRQFMLPRCSSTLCFKDKVGFVSAGNCWPCVYQAMSLMLSTKARLILC